MDNLLDDERRAYYTNKRERIRRERLSKLSVQRDALFINTFGLSSFMELVPEARGYDMYWFDEVAAEIAKIKKREFADQVTGYFMASAATKSRKAFRMLKSLLRELGKQ